MSNWNIDSHLAKPSLSSCTSDELKHPILPVDAIIMAGGLGSRLRPLTYQQPKPLIKVAGQTLIDYNLQLLEEHGIQHIHISVRYLRHQIIRHILDNPPEAARICFIHEEKPLGTIGSIALPEAYQHDTLLVMNSDNLTNTDLYLCYEKFILEDADMLVATVPYQVTVPYGVIQSQQGVITHLTEKPTYTLQANAGIYLFRKKFISLIPKNEYMNATEFIHILIKAGKKVINYPLENYWQDISSPEDLEKAEQKIRLGLY